MLVMSSLRIVMKLSLKLSKQEHDPPFQSKSKRKNPSLVDSISSNECLGTKSLSTHDRDIREETGDDIHDDGSDSLPSDDEEDRDYDNVIDSNDDGWMKPINEVLLCRDIREETGNDVDDDGSDSLPSDNKEERDCVNVIDSNDDCWTKPINGVLLCRVPGCRRKEPFTQLANLNRHELSKH